MHGNAVTHICIYIYVHAEFYSAHMHIVIIYMYMHNTCRHGISDTSEVWTGCGLATLHESHAGFIDKAMLVAKVPACASAMGLH